MPGLKGWSGGAVTTTLVSGIGTLDTAFTIAAATGWPTVVPFVVVVSPDTPQEEKILITARAGTSVTNCTRGYDGTIAATHATGATVQHVLDADTIAEANQHVNDDTRDDHSQYYNAARHDATDHTAALGTSSLADIGTRDHHHLTGLADDDHTHYLTATRHDVTDRHDHGTQGGLGDDDHTQYIKVDGTRGFTGVTAVAAGTGSALTLARSDHEHPRDWDVGATGGSVTVNVGATAVVAGLSVTTTAGAAERLMIFVRGVISWSAAVPGVGGGYAQLDLLQDGVFLGTVDRRLYPETRQGSIYLSGWWTVTPPAGSHAYTVRVANESDLDAAGHTISFQGFNYELMVMGQ